MPVNGTHTNTNNNGTSTLRDKIQFTTNTPQRLTLEFDPPDEPRAGRFGDQYMYFFAGGKIAWFDPPVHAQIVASGAHAGEEIEITKRETRKGNRKHVTWEVVVIGDEPEFAGPHAEYDPDYAPHAQPPAKTASPAPKPAPAPAVIAPAASPEPNPLAQALILAIDAVEIANAHGQRKHHWDEGLALGDEAIVKLAITAYIQAQGGKQARA